MKCCYHVPEYWDPVMGEMHPGTEADCEQEATHLSCMPYTDTPTCGGHACRCAKPLRCTPPADDTKPAAPPVRPTRWED